MTKAVRALFALLFFGVASQGWAAARVECGSVKGHFITSAVGYCALLPPSYDSKPSRKFPVLYFLHGLGGDHTFLVASGGWNLIADAWEQMRLGEFVIIMPQADSTFYINSKDGTVRYEDFFIRDFIPQMEKKYRLSGRRAARAIEGISMGGYGALRFAFKYPQMFVSVGAHMPALMERLPRGSANAGLNAFLGTSFGTPLDEAFWKANTPFVYARSANLRGLKIYMDCGDSDDYGFDAGVRQMHKLLLQRGIENEGLIYPGRHDWQFVAQHLLTSLQFHSQAFGLKH